MHGNGVGFGGGYDPVPLFFLGEGARWEALNFCRKNFKSLLFFTLLLNEFNADTGVVL